MSNVSAEERIRLEERIRMMVPLVRRLVEKYRYLGDPEAMESDALVGVWRAAGTWDPEGGRSFKSYAYMKAEYAIFTGRRTRFGTRRHPKEQPSSLDRLVDDRLGDRDVLSTLDDPRADVFAQAAARIELGKILRLKGRDREILVRLMLGEEFTEIGERFGVTGSRISQLRDGIVEKIDGTYRRPIVARPERQMVPGPHAPAPAIPGLRGLTPEELAVLVAFGRGESGPAIAARIGRSPETVNSHRDHLLAKLRARTITHAYAIAFRETIV